MRRTGEKTAEPGRYVSRFASPIGGIILTSDGTFLTGLRFEEDGNAAEGKTGEAGERSRDVFQEAERWLERYFGGGEPDFTPIPAPAGSDFDVAVWRLLLSIPYGRTASYGEIASRLAGEGKSARMLARAVGGAVGRNPVSLIIPCHRVIGSDGALAGYRGGSGRKLWLLAHEGVTLRRTERGSGAPPAPRETGRRGDGRLRPETRPDSFGDA